MAAPLLVIALDAADWERIREWSGRGLLPNLGEIVRRGSAWALDNHPLYRNETPWTSLLTGCSPERTGHWTSLRYRAEGYRVFDAGAYSFDPFRPFYARAPGLRVTVFDLPHCGRLFAGVDGVQVLGWGAHSPMGSGRSLPRGLLRSLRRRFGPHPAMRVQNRGSWWDGGRLTRLRAALLEGVRRRGALLRALRAEHPADLCVLAFSELHIAGHHFWHLSDPGHPAFGGNAPPLPDYLLDVYRETDRELGRLLEGLAAGERLLLLSPEGGAANGCDLNSLVFLPEFLFRWSFPGRTLAWGKGQGDAGGTPVVPDRADWVEAVWRDGFSDLPPSWLPRPLGGAFRSLAGLPGAHFPFYALRRLGPLQWQPPVWYRPWWPRMRAFALPSYGDGYVRLNVRGREPQGVVPPAEAAAVCDELSERLLALRDPRLGGKLVRQVVRTRRDWSAPGEGRLPDADLVVLWERGVNDTAEDREAGRLGPAPFWKSGGHRPTGFLVALGPGIAAGAGMGQARVTDVAPTVLAMLGAPGPDGLDGRPLSGLAG